VLGMTCILIPSMAMASSPPLLYQEVLHSSGLGKGKLGECVRVVDGISVICVKDGIRVICVKDGISVIQVLHMMP
jgi:hypothetical protein